jgi:hypothetical protein
MSFYDDLPIDSHRYFEYISKDFRSLKSDPAEQQKWTMWQAAVLALI